MQDGASGACCMMQDIFQRNAVPFLERCRAAASAAKTDVDSCVAASTAAPGRAASDRGVPASSPQRPAVRRPACRETRGVSISSMTDLHPSDRSRGGDPAPPHPSPAACPPPGRRPPSVARRHPACCASSSSAQGRSRCGACCHHRLRPSPAVLARRPSPSERAHLSLLMLQTQTQTDR